MGGRQKTTIFMGLEEKKKGEKTTKTSKKSKGKSKR